MVWQDTSRPALRSRSYQKPGSMLKKAGWLGSMIELYVKCASILRSGNIHDLIWPLERFKDHRHGKYDVPV